MEHVVLFSLAGFAGYLINANRSSSIGHLFLLGLAAAGVYFISWWALLTTLIGAVFGGKVFWNAVKSGRIKSEE